MITIETLIESRIAKMASSTAREYWRKEFDGILSEDLSMIYIDEMGLLTVANWRAGVSIPQAMNILYTLSMLSNITVVSSFNGRMITIGLDRHNR
jgi:hypothetical protein